MASGWRQDGVKAVETDMPGVSEIAGHARRIGQGPIAERNHMRPHARLYFLPLKFDFL